MKLSEIELEDIRVWPLAASGIMFYILACLCSEPQPVFMACTLILYTAAQFINLARENALERKDKISKNNS